MWPVLEYLYDVGFIESSPLFRLTYFIFACLHNSWLEMPLPPSSVAGGVALLSHSCMADMAPPCSPLTPTGSLMETSQAQISAPSFGTPVLRPNRTQTTRQPRPCDPRARNRRNPRLTHESIGPAWPRRCDLPEAVTPSNPLRLVERPRLLGPPDSLELNRPHRSPAAWPSVDSMAANPPPPPPQTCSRPSRRRRPSSR